MEPTARSLARTYTDRVYPDPWQKVLDYERVQSYAAQHPDHGRTRVGRELELPASRVRGWLDGGMPDSVRGIRTAERHGWLDPDPEGPMASALIDLLAHVLAGGSIVDPTFVVRLAVGSRVDVDELRSAFDRVGVRSQLSHVDVDNRATEVIPTDGGAVLGRCLVAMGAPLGSKTGLQQLPDVVHEATIEQRTSFCRIYLAHRGAVFDGKAPRVMVEERPETYVDDLAALFEAVTDAQVNVGTPGITVSADAARRLES